jgi:hypothetical protein
MTEERKVGYAYQLSAQFGKDTMFQINGNLPVGATVEEISAEMDKLHAVTVRQQAKAALVAKKTEISEYEAKRNAIADDITAAEARFEGKTLSSSETQARHNLGTTLRSYNDKLAILGKELEELEALAK